MIDYSDPCSFAPCTGIVGGNFCRGGGDDVDDQSMSLFSGSGRRNSHASTKLHTTNPMTPRGLLMSRISEFQVKGWLSQQEHRKYSEMLLSSKQMEEKEGTDNNNNNNNDTNDENNNSSSNNKDDNGGQGDQQQQEAKQRPPEPTPMNSIEFLKNLERELDKMEMKHSGGNASTILNKTIRIANIIATPMSNAARSTPRMERPHGLSVFPEPKSAAEYNNNSNNLMMRQQQKNSQDNDENLDSNNFGSGNSPSPSIVEPKDLSKISDLSHAELEELFVEMCFFARLGFVQPPCCLKCTYRESMKDAVPNTQCPKWVVWRKSANLLLHPKQMDGNIVVVQCFAARKLLSGGTVDNFKWDKTKKILVFQG